PRRRQLRAFMAAILGSDGPSVAQLGERSRAGLRAGCCRKRAFRAAAALKHVPTIPESRQAYLELRSVRLGGSGGSGDSRARAQHPLDLAMLRQGRRRRIHLRQNDGSSALGSNRLDGKPVRAASDAQVTAGFVALSTTSRATGSLELFDSNNTKVFAPTCRPGTVPVPLCDSQLVTSRPLSVSLARRTAPSEGPLTWIPTESDVTNPAVGLLVLVIV